MCKRSKELNHIIFTGNRSSFLCNERELFNDKFNVIVGTHFQYIFRDMSHNITYNKVHY